MLMQTAFIYTARSGGGSEISLSRFPEIITDNKSSASDILIALGLLKLIQHEIVDAIDILSSESNRCKTTWSRLRCY